jgi:endonuclease VIII
MPEGHTIHRAARDQGPMLKNKRLAVSSPQGRFLQGAQQLDGRRCTAVEAWGKHLLYRFAGGDSLHIHLGLFGRFHLFKAPAGEPKGLVRVRLASATHVVDINGPNCCEVLDAPGVAALCARLGPDILRDDADPERAWTKIHRSRAPIGQLLMDQAVVAGLGNIYRTEILWRQRLHPQMPGRDLSREAFDAFWADAARLLRLGVDENAIITVDGGARGRGRYGTNVNIFKKKQCPRCHGAIRHFVMAGRNVFCCERCQAEAPVVSTLDPTPLATPARRRGERRHA